MGEDTRGNAFGTIEEEAVGDAGHDAGNDVIVFKTKQYCTDNK